MAVSVVFPVVQFTDLRGRPLSGGRIHTYVHGTNIRAMTYQDAKRTARNTNPIILNARGEAAIYLDEGVAYKFVVQDADGATIMTQEPVYGAVWPNPDEWPDNATLAYRYMLDAKGAAESVGIVAFFDTHAQAMAEIGDLNDGDVIEISEDENHFGTRSRYRVQKPNLEFMVNLGSFLNQDITVKIPSDFPDLQSAIDYLSSLQASRGSIIELLIESGHRLTSGVKVNDGSFGHFYISSEDSVVYLDPGFSSQDDVVLAEHAEAPTLNCLIDMQGRGHFGYVLRKSSRGRVAPNCGVKGGDVNLQVFEASTIDARSTIWTDAVLGTWGRNVWISSASVADMQLYDNLHSPTDCSRAAVRNIYVSRASVLNFSDGISKDSASDVGLYVIRSYCSATNAVLTGNAVYGLFASAGSVVDGRGIDCSDSGSRGIFADGGATASAGNAIADRCGVSGVYASGTSRINFNGGSARDCGQHGVYSNSGSVISAPGAFATGSPEEFFADEGGTIYRNSELFFGSIVYEKGVRIVSSYNQNGVEVTKFSDGSMEQRIKYLRATYSNAQRLVANTTWEENFIDRPELYITAYHRSFQYLPTAPTHFTGFAGDVVPSILIRNVSVVDAQIYLASPAGGFEPGDDAYISVLAKGRWK